MSPKNKEDIVFAGIFRRIFANEFVFYSKMRIARWNLAGPDFYRKYNLFREIYKQSEKAMSKVACQLVGLGEPLNVTSSELLDLSKLNDKVIKNNDSQECINIMINDIELIRNLLFESKDDLGFSLYDWDMGGFIDDLIDIHQQMISLLSDDWDS